MGLLAFFAMHGICVLVSLCTHEEWNLVTSRMGFYIEIIKDLSEGETVAFTAAFNTFVELSSSIIPAVICALFLTHVFQKKAIFYSIGAVLTFLLLSTRLWRYWFDPHVPTYMKIIGSATPIVDVLVFIFIIWLTLKIKHHITSGSTPDQD
jgi:hypothetical protein